MIPCNSVFKGLNENGHIHVCTTSITNRRPKLSDGNSFLSRAKLV